MSMRPHAELYERTDDVAQLRPQLMQTKLRLDAEPRPLENVE
jgi:hypothetical protein